MDLVDTAGRVGCRLERLPGKTVLCSGVRVLFISHSYPPIVGGVETHNAKLYAWLSKSLPVRLLANRHRGLIPLFLLYACVRAVALAGTYDVLLLGSGVLAIVGWVVKRVTRKPVIAVTHGLDLTFSRSLYQRMWVGKFLPSLDKLIAVGHETIAVGVKKGIPAAKFTFIPNGVDPHELKGPHSLTTLEQILRAPLAHRKLILTSGRLVRRKGVAWFVQNVMPRLPADVMYLVAGAGPDRPNIDAAILASGLSGRVKLLGRVSAETRNLLMNTCHLFVQPNIPVEGDMEGFGISVIEAGACGLPVVASRLEGLLDSIKNSENGILVESRNVEEWVAVVDRLLEDEPYRASLGGKASKFVEEHYGWRTVAQLYVNQIRLLAGPALT